MKILLELILQHRDVCAEEKEDEDSRVVVIIMERGKWGSLEKSLSEPNYTPPCRLLDPNDDYQKKKQR